MSKPSQYFKVRDRKRNPFERFNGQHVVLFWDPQVRLHFVMLTSKWVVDVAAPNGKRPEYQIFTFPSKEEAQHWLEHPEVLEHYGEYETQVVPYEALKEFADHHIRRHWVWDAPVQFFGPSAAMDWISKLTLQGGLPRDPSTGLFLDWDRIKLPHVPEGVGGMRTDYTVDLKQQYYLEMKAKREGQA